MKILKMLLKLSYFNSKRILEAIFSLTVLSNCVSSSSNFGTIFLIECTKLYRVFQVIG